MRKVKLVFSLTFLFLLLIPLFSEARWGHRGYWRGPGVYGPGWHGGYWFHGSYVERAGWWWIVGPYWYYYADPIYPYPPENMPPVYYVQVPNAPPPPAAPAPAPPAGGTNVGAGTPTTLSTGMASGASAPVALTSPPPPSGGAPIAGSKTKAQAFSYYCEKTKSYYPNAANCAEGWIATPVNAPN